MIRLLLGYLSYFIRISYGFNDFKLKIIKGIFFSCEASASAFHKYHLLNTCCSFIHSQFNSVIKSVQIIMQNWTNSFLRRNTLNFCVSHANLHTLSNFNGYLIEFVLISIGSKIWRILAPLGLAGRSICLASETGFNRCFFIIFFCRLWLLYSVKLSHLRLGREHMYIK